MPGPGQAQSPIDDAVTLLISGRILDTQANPIPDVMVQAILDGQPIDMVIVDEANDWPAAQSRLDGSFLVALPLPPETVEALQAAKSHLVLRFHRPTFTNKSLSISPPAYGQGSDANGTPHTLVYLGHVTLARHPNPAFFIATATFLVVFGLISFRVIHETVAALLGAITILAITYALGTFNDEFWIISFERAITFIDFNCSGTDWPVSMAGVQGLSNNARQHLAAGNHPDRPHRRYFGLLKRRHRYLAHGSHQRSDRADDARASLRLCHS
jgi:hypothetical protein